MISTIVFLLVVLPLCHSITIEGCPSGLHRNNYLQVRGDYCYVFMTYKSNDFDHAQRDCQTHGGNLATVMDKDTQDYFYTMLRNTYHADEPVWVGLSDEHDEGKWEWNSGKPVTYTNWDDGQPGIDSALEDCAAINMEHNGKWFDYRCNDLLFIHFDHPYICEYGPFGITTGTPTNTRATTGTTTPTTNTTTTKQQPVDPTITTTTTATTEADTTQPPGSAFRVEISPNTVNTLEPSPINVSCITDAVFEQEAKEIIIMEVIGNNGSPIALLRHESGVSFDNHDYTNVRAEGRINKNASLSYLTLTLLAPKETDAGFYQCVVYYLDASGVLNEKRDGANLTYIEPDIKMTVQYLLQKVSRLETEVKELRKQPDTITNTVISAFSAKHNMTASDNIGDTIVFNEIIMKEGSGYDENTGLFTVPRSGIYIFSLFAMLDTANGYMELSLNVNNNRVAEWSAASESNYNDQASISALVKLKIGDVVNVIVVAKSPGSIHLQPGYNMFSGYLLCETGKTTTTTTTTTTPTP